MENIEIFELLADDESPNTWKIHMTEYTCNKKKVPQSLTTLKRRSTFANH